MSMKEHIQHVFFGLRFAALCAFVLFGAGLSGNAEEYCSQEGSRRLKAAFIGDQGLNDSSKRVLELIKSEGAEMVLHQGDLDYHDNPKSWQRRVDSILGENFPYFVSPGNHDVNKWKDYQKILMERLNRIEGAECKGDYGVNAACNYKGLFFILSGAGTLGDGHSEFIKEQLAQTESSWKVCSWHKNQTKLQVGDKDDEVGWGPYEECRKGGAIIATGHNHVYARTKTLINMEEQIVDPEWSFSNKVRVSPGKTFVFVSGLAGAVIRKKVRCKPALSENCGGIWGKIYTYDQKAKHGALFITFCERHGLNQADGYFKNIDGELIDVFRVYFSDQKK